jgi:hypothetical protein
MLQDLVTQFLGSGAAAETIASIAQKTGLNEGQARQAVQATAEGTAQAAEEGGGLSALAGSLLGGGGGGLAGLAGSLLGGGAPAAGSPLVDTVAGLVADKTGLSRELARTVVGIALPKITEFFQKASVGGGKGGGGGLLGGLLGG